MQTPPRARPASRASVPSTRPGALLRPPAGRSKVEHGGGVTMKPAGKNNRALGILLMVGLALVAGVACGQSPEVKKQGALTRGEKYLKDGKPNEAIIEFRNALQIDQNFVPAIQGLGRAYAAKSWYRDALREFQRAQKSAPDSLSLAADVGRSSVEVGAWNEAEAQATLILGKDPHNREG